MRLILQCEQQHIGFALKRRVATPHKEGSFFFRHPKLSPAQFFQDAAVTLNLKLQYLCSQQILFNNLTPVG